MCGRYYVSDETAKEIEKLIKQAEEKLRRESATALKQIRSTDIHPADEAPVLLATGGGIACTWLRWGFPMMQQNRKLVFNARCESALEKAFFREGIRHRRIAVPAAAFYEWDQYKTKFTFCKNDRKTMFLAGCCRSYDDGDHFVVLTTAANQSMRPIHDRMPLLLQEDEVADWILDSKKTGTFLQQVPFLLDRSTEYEQLCLF